MDNYHRRTIETHARECHALLLEHLTKKRNNLMSADGDHPIGVLQRVQQSDSALPKGDEPPEGVHAQQLSQLAI